MLTYVAESVYLWPVPANILFTHVMRFLIFETGTAHVRSERYTALSPTRKPAPKLPVVQLLELTQVELFIIYLNLKKKGKSLLRMKKAIVEKSIISPEADTINQVKIID